MPAIAATPVASSGVAQPAQLLAVDLGVQDEQKTDLPLFIATSGNGDVFTGATDFTPLASLDATTALTWRIEVTNGGKNWNWRRGSGSARVGRYGGIFGLLSHERQTQYERNKRSYSRTTKKITPKAATTARKGGRTRNSANRTRGVPARRDRVGASTESTRRVTAA